MRLTNKIAAALGGLTLAASGAFASPVTPSYDNFGKLDAATFGGSGIPNDPAAISTITSGGQTVLTLGLIATPRFSSSLNPVGNNGAGVYHAPNGPYTPFPGGDSNYARWNFNFYIAGSAIGAYSYRLYYDMDAGAGTDDTTMGVVSFGGLTATSQNSWNLGMNFLAVDNAGLNFAPDFTAFNPSSPGEYSFALVAYNQDGSEAARSAILVTVPEPASVALVGIALAGMGALSRRRKKA